MAKTKEVGSGPRAEAAATLDSLHHERERMVPPLEAQAKAAQAEADKAAQAYRVAKTKADEIRRSLARTRNSLKSREECARSALVATSDPRIAEYIDDMQSQISFRRNKFIAPTPFGMMRWTAAIGRAVDEARKMQTDPKADGDVGKMLDKLREQCDAMAERISESDPRDLKAAEGPTLGQYVEAAPSVPRAGVVKEAAKLRDR